MGKAKMTTDGVKLLHEWFVRGNAEMERLLDEERKNAEIAARIRALRTSAGLSQRQLAKIVGTTASVICQLEDADYEGHSLSMLRRIGAALGHRVELRFVRARRRATGTEAGAGR